MVLQAFITSFESTGQVLSLAFAAMMSRDGGMLAISDAVLVLSTFAVVPLVKVLHHYRVRYGAAFFPVQLAWYLALVVGVTKWTYVRYVDGAYQ